MSRPKRPLALGVAAAAAATLAACGGGSAPAATASGGAGDIAVTAGDDTCTVATTDLDAGTHRFTVTNTGSKVTEFYVYATGDRVVGEVENIAPGVARQLLVQLPAGTYEATCKPGMVGNGIRTALTVTGAHAAADAPLSTAVAGYTGYVQQQVAVLQARTGEFVAAVKAGDLARAKALYPVARSPYEMIEPVAESFQDLDPKIDARENDVDPADWTGFHVLERDLWQTGDISGSGPVADQLVVDVDDLAGRVQALDLQPLQLANGALGLLDEIATGKITGEEERYSHTDLFDFAANLEGSRQVVQYLRPVIADRDPKLAASLDQQFSAVSAELEKYRRGEGWVSYTDLTEDQLHALSDSINALAAVVSHVAVVVSR